MSFEIFFVDGEEALAEVKRVVPEVKEFDKALLELLTKQERETITQCKEVDRMTASATIGFGLKRVFNLLGACWVRIDENVETAAHDVPAPIGLPEAKLRSESEDAFLARLSSRSWAWDREIGDGALCGASLLTFLPDVAWGCRSGNRSKWFAVRCKHGPSLTVGVFDELREQCLVKYRVARALSGRKVSFIACIDRRFGLGKDGDLLFRLPEDMAHFKSTTMGHDVLMGRKTYESIGKPLAGRTNYVISSDPEFNPEGVTVIRSYAELPGGEKQLFVIGGGKVYTDLFPYTSEILLTVVDTEVEADVFFPEKFTWGWTHVCTGRRQSAVCGEDSRPLEYWIEHWTRNDNLF